MEPEVMAVWLSFLFYITHVLVPIIPAAIIYKMFPSDKIGIKGILQGLKINATGAFAAYVIVFLLGFFTVDKTLCLISGLSKQSWEVRAEVSFVDKEHRDLDEVDLERMNREMRVDVRPDKKSVTRENMCFLLPRFEDGMTVTIGIEGFVPVSKQIDPLDKQSIEVDPYDNVIRLKKRLYFERIEQQYRPDASLALQPTTMGPSPQ
jgi:hypothetical protein